MRVIIVGAGNIGFIAAQTICDEHDVLIIENDPKMADAAATRLNVSVLQVDGTNPKNLKFAIESHKAEAIISTVNNDDSNLFVCMISKQIKPSIFTVASVKNPDFIIPVHSETGSGVDKLISPEIITAQKIYMLCVLENAVSYEVMEKYGTYVAVFKVGLNSPVIGTVPIQHEDLDCEIVGIYRDDDLQVNIDTTEFHLDDNIIVMGNISSLKKFNERIGTGETAREFTILGGSIVGANVAKLISSDKSKRFVKIIEKNNETCVRLSRELDGVMIVNGDFTDPDLQYAEDIYKADCIIPATSQDDTNLFVCMSAQKNKTRKIISRYFKQEYSEIFSYTGLDCIISYNNIVMNEVTKCISNKDSTLIRLKKNEVFFVHEVNKSSKLLNRYLGDVKSIEGIRIAAVVKSGNLVRPRLNTKVDEGDQIIVFTNITKHSELAKIFGKNTITGLSS